MAVRTPSPNFINDECKSPDGFDYDKFFDLCSINGLPEDKIAHYKEQVDSKSLVPRVARE